MAPLNHILFRQGCFNLFRLQSPSRTSAGTRSGPCCAPSSRRRGLRINSLPRRRESSLTPSLLLSHAEPLRWVRHGVPLSPSPANRLSSNSVMSSGRSFTLSMNRSIFLRRPLDIAGDLLALFFGKACEDGKHELPLPRQIDTNTQYAQAAPKSSLDSLSLRVEKNQATPEKCLISRGFQPVCFTM